MDVDGDGAAAEDLTDALDRVAHHRPSDVVGVMVGGEDPREAHAVTLEHVQDLVDAVRGIHDHRFPGVVVAYEIDEIDHLGRQRVAGREVPS